MMNCRSSLSGGLHTGHLHCAQHVQLQSALDWHDVQLMRRRMDRCHLQYPSVPACITLRAHMVSAICTSGCLYGSCFNPNQCYCNAGWSGPTCSVANGAASATIGLNKCTFPAITTTCKLANGQSRTDCPAGYTLAGNQPCADIPGYDVNVCTKTCCDGWTGAACTTRLNFATCCDC